LASKGFTPPADKLQPPVAPAAVPAARAAMRAVAWREFAQDTVAWDALATNAAEPNPFFEAWYAQPSLEAFDAEGDVKILSFEQEGRLLGLMPIARQSRYYGMPIPNIGNWLHANAFLGTPLVARGSEVAFWQALLRWMDANAGAALFLHLRAIPLDGPLYAALRGVLECESRAWQCVHREERALLASAQDPQAYWEASLSGKKRKELRRQLRRLSEEGEVLFERQEDDAGLDQWLDEFLALEKAGWKGTEGSALACAADTERLFRESLAGAAARGKLERLTMRFDGKPIAMLATFLCQPGAFSYKTAFDEDFSRFSPGVLLQEENLRMLERKDIAWTDSCASADHPMIDHIWRERRAVGRFSIAIGGTARRFAFRQLSRVEQGHDPEGGA
jgi:CelD/BcsL family acetyltransferase involved in cellulose biosynthesis